MTPDEVKNVATEAAREAVREMFLTLGVNVKDPEAIKKVQRDFSNLSDWGDSIELVKRTSIRATVTVLVTGFLGLAWMAFGFKGLK